MLAIFLDNWLSIVVCAVLTYCVHLILLRKHISTFFEPIHLHSIIAAITIGMLYGMYLDGTIILDDFFLFAAFFIVALVGLFSYRGKPKFRLLKPSICNALEVNIIWTAAVISILATAVIAAIIFLTGASGDDRVVIQRKLRVIDILRQGGVGMAAPGLWYIILLDRRGSVKITSAVLLFTLGLVGLFSGSKSFLLMTVVPLFLLRPIIQLSEDYIRILRRISVALLTLVVAGIFLNYYLYRDAAGPEQGLILFADRIAAIADAYDYAFKDRAIDSLYGQYEPFAYIFHPFLRFFGLSGYEYPLGAALFELRTGDNSGFGPNANLTLLIYIFFPQARWPIMIMVGLFLGFFMAWSRKIGYSAMAQTPERPIRALIPFCLLYLPCTMIYSDIGIFQHNLISVLVLAIASYLVAKAIGFRSSVPPRKEQVLPCCCQS